MKTKIIVTLALTVVSAALMAWPAKEDTAKVASVVQDLMQSDQVALKEGRKTRSDVAASARALAGQADSEAAKLLLLKGAFNLYVRDGAYDPAVETLKALRAAIPDIPPENLANIIEGALRRAPRKDGVRLYQMLDETRTFARYQTELKKLLSAAQKNAHDKALQLKIAEHYALLGDWPKALDAFEKSSDRKAAEIAKKEMAGAQDAKPLADFWWNYPEGKADELEKSFKLHAAALYESAMTAGTLMGLNKVQATRRIDEAKALGESLVSEKMPLGGVQLWEGGPYWAECNVGASQPEEYGYYFWWGDTVGYKRNASNNGWISVKDGAKFSFSEGNCPTFKKDNSQLQSAGYIDGSGNLVAAHDAATTHLGSPWRMPTDAEFAALINNCTTTWTTRKGVSGRLVSGKGAFATKSIFLPAAGGGLDSRLDNLDSNGNDWSSSPNSDNSLYAWYLDLHSGFFRRYNEDRWYGRSVRPIRGFSIPSLVMSSTKIVPPAHSFDTPLVDTKREVEEKVAAQREDKLYCVIDLSGGPKATKYPVSYLNAVPKGGWSDEYKTTKLVLRKIKASYENNYSFCRIEGRARRSATAAFKTQ